MIRSIIFLILCTSGLHAASSSQKTQTKWFTERGKIACKTIEQIADEIMVVATGDVPDYARCQELLQSITNSLCSDITIDNGRLERLMRLLMNAQSPEIRALVHYVQAYSAYLIFSEWMMADGTWDRKVKRGIICPHQRRICTVPCYESKVNPEDRFCVLYNPGIQQFQIKEFETEMGERAITCETNLQRIFAAIKTRNSAVQ